MLEFILMLGSMLLIMRLIDKDPFYAFIVWGAWALLMDLGGIWGCVITAIAWWYLFAVHTKQASEVKDDY